MIDIDNHTTNKNQAGIDFNSPQKDINVYHNTLPDLSNHCKCSTCKKQIVAKGYCGYHYNLCGRPLKCSLCSKPMYAKGYCRNHYCYYVVNFNRNHTKNCIVGGCKRKTKTKYCSFHRNRLKAGLPLDNKKYFAKGKRNGMWKGGISEYKNHYTMKLIRKELLKEKNYTCGECGGKGNEIHHLDKSKENHSKKNLKVLCHKCHVGIYHRQDIGREKKFGNLSLKDIAILAGCSVGTVFKIASKNYYSKKYSVVVRKILTTI